MFENWEELKENCLNCRKCNLCEARSNVVFGVGNPCAKVMFIGEGPGRNEDLKGEPFVGAGGQLLDKYLAAVDLEDGVAGRRAVGADRALPPRAAQGRDVVFVEPLADGAVRRRVHVTRDDVRVIGLQQPV